MDPPPSPELTKRDSASPKQDIWDGLNAASWEEESEDQRSSRREYIKSFNYGMFANEFDVAATINDLFKVEDFILGLKTLRNLEDNEFYSEGLASARSKRREIVCDLRRMALKSRRCLLDLPPEILPKIIVHLNDYKSVVRTKRTCKALANAVRVAKASVNVLDMKEMEEHPEIYANFVDIESTQLTISNYDERDFVADYTEYEIAQEEAGDSNKDFSHLIDYKCVGRQRNLPIFGKSGLLSNMPNLTRIHLKNCHFQRMLWFQQKLDHLELEDCQLYYNTHYSLWIHTDTIIFRDVTRDQYSNQQVYESILNSTGIPGMWAQAGYPDLGVWPVKKISWMDRQMYFLMEDDIVNHWLIVPHEVVFVNGNDGVIGRRFFACGDDLENDHFGACKDFGELWSYRTLFGSRCLEALGQMISSPAVEIEEMRREVLKDRIRFTLKIKRT